MGYDASIRRRTTAIAAAAAAAVRRETAEGTSFSVRQRLGELGDLHIRLSEVGVLRRYPNDESEMVLSKREVLQSTPPSQTLRRLRSR
jgi:hypothetical protein